MYDRRPERRWRHLDLGGRRCFLRMPLRRLRCPEHGVVTEAVPFAPAHSGSTYAFEEEVAWLAQRADKTAITELLRVSWRSVGRIVERWIARHRSGDQLDGLRKIDVDDSSRPTQWIVGRATTDPMPRRSKVCTVLHGDTQGTHSTRSAPTCSVQFTSNTSKTFVPVAAAAAASRASTTPRGGWSGSSLTTRSRRPSPK
ncbi:MAG: helix-turn-helix domain-containing protein [Candidatus Limnocylindria bacterium]